MRSARMLTTWLCLTCATTVSPAGQVVDWNSVARPPFTSSPNAADLNGDGVCDIIVGTQTGSVVALDLGGNALDGWPQQTGGPVYSTPAIGDIDGDGDVEVVVGSSDGNVYAWHADGSLVEGWPQSTGGPVWSSPALVVHEDGDVRGVAVGSNDGKVYFWNGEGGIHPGWPRETGGRIIASPAVPGDIVVAASCDGACYAWYLDGTSCIGWPKKPSGTAGAGSQFISSPVVRSQRTSATRKPWTECTILCGSQDGRVHSWPINPDGPTHQWMAPFPLLSSPTPLGAMLCGRIMLLIEEARKGPVNAPWRIENPYVQSSRLSLPGLFVPAPRDWVPRQLGAQREEVLGIHGGIVVGGLAGAAGSPVSWGATSLWLDSEGMLWCIDWATCQVGQRTGFAPPCSISPLIVPLAEGEGALVVALSADDKLVCWRWQEARRRYFIPGISGQDVAWSPVYPTEPRTWRCDSGNSGHYEVPTKPYDCSAIAPEALPRLDDGDKGMAVTLITSQTPPISENSVTAMWVRELGQ